MKPGHISLSRRVALAPVGIAAALTLALIPFADRAGPAIPGIVPFFVGGVLVTALATSFLLFVRFREGAPA